MFHLQSMYKENIPYSQVFKCKWYVHIHVGYIQIQKDKFCSTLNEKCIIIRNIVKRCRKPSFCLYCNSVEKLYQPYPKGFFYTSGIKDKESTTRDNCSVLVFPVTLCSYF